MKVAKVIGRVVATRKVEGLKGVKLLLVQPTDWLGRPKGEPYVAADSVGAGAGEWVFIVAAREAAVSLKKFVPVDAAIMGIIDGVQLEEEFEKSLREKK